MHKISRDFGCCRRIIKTRTGVITLRVEDTGVHKGKLPLSNHSIEGLSVMFSHQYECLSTTLKKKTGFF